MNKLFSVVIPVYGNEKNLPVTIPYVIAEAKKFNHYDVEIILVCDGSPDNSWEIMKKYRQEYPDLLKIVNLTRNFGQGSAQRCGVDLAKGDVVGIYTADMQDPFELFAEMLIEWEKGCKFVLAARKDREEKGLIAFCSKKYNQLVNKYISNLYPEGGFDFYLVDRCIIEEYKNTNIYYPFRQIHLIWMGYKYKKIEYTRKKRKIGKSGYNFFGKFDIALRNFITQTDILFNIMMVAGIVMILFGLVFGLLDFILLMTGILNFNIVLDVMFIMCAFSGTIQLSLSIVGKYVWHTMTYTKNDPCYIIDEII